MSYELPSLPAFRDGALLGASDLNRIGQAQAYVKHNLNRFNPGWYYMPEDETRHVCHRHRYLHWVTSTASGATLKLNGSTVATASGTSGYVDLNALGLADYEVYEVYWTGATTVCKRLYEWPDTSGSSLTLPETSPTFGSGTASAADLNKICTNTQYLIDNIAKRPYVPFTSRRWSVTPSKSIKFALRKAHRYLGFFGELWYAGEEGDDQVDINWRINSTSLRSFDTSGTGPDGGNYYAFAWWYDLEGTSHTDASSDQFAAALPVTWVTANGTTLSLNNGDWYEFECHVTEAHSWTRLRIELVGESPQKSIW